MKYFEKKKFIKEWWSLGGPTFKLWRGFWGPKFKPYGGPGSRFKLWGGPKVLDPGVLRLLLHRVRRLNG